MRKLTITLTLLFALFAVSAFATDYYVDAAAGSDTNPGTDAMPFKTITKGTTVALSGDKVIVRPGTYNLLIGEVMPLVVKPGVQLVSSAGPYTTIIDAVNLNNRIILLNAGTTSTLVEGFTMKNGKAPQTSGTTTKGGAIYSTNGDQSKISRNIIVDNESFGLIGTATNLSGDMGVGGGIAVDNGSSPTIVNNIVLLNEAHGGSGANGTAANGSEGQGGGIWADATSTPLIVNNTIDHNIAFGGGVGSGSLSGQGGSTGRGGGLHITGGTVLNNIFTNNSARGVPFGGGAVDGGIYRTDGGTANVDHNDFFTNFVQTRGGQLDDGYVGTNALLVNPFYVVHTETEHDLHLQRITPLRQAGTSTSAPAVDLDLRARPTPPSMGAYEPNMGIVRADFDADRKTDISIYRHSAGSWHVIKSTGGFQEQYGFGGVAGDKPAPGDYDGDGKTDFAIYRSGAGSWHVILSGGGFLEVFGFGGPTDLPVQADYDGDGKTDVAIYRTAGGNFHVVKSSGGFIERLGFGQPADVPVPADYDGDGDVDFAIYRNGYWKIETPTGIFEQFGFGTATDVPVPADWDGDFKADMAIFRPGEGGWHILNSSGGGQTVLGWGMNAGDRPAVGDYDGDGKADFAIFRPPQGSWHIMLSAGGFIEQFTFGNVAGDEPVPAWAH